jgi:hypothetical protein
MSTWRRPPHCIKWWRALGSSSVCASLRVCAPIDEEDEEEKEEEEEDEDEEEEEEDEDGLESAGRCAVRQASAGRPHASHPFASITRAVADDARNASKHRSAILPPSA